MERNMSGTQTRRPAAFNDEAAAALARQQPASDPAPEAAPGAGRSNRRPFGARDQKLAYAARPGYHRHWFNDDPGRIDRAHEAGYEHVKDGQTGKNVSTVVGTARGGGSLVAYLMEIPEEWYREDMAAGESLVLARKREIETGQLEAPSGRDGQLRYVPQDRGISISETNRR
jgi:hypothetical protein